MRGYHPFCPFACQVGYVCQPVNEYLFSVVQIVCGSCKSGPSSRAHELRKGDSCPGSGGIECAQFGVQLDGTPTSSNNELVWFNFDSVETTVYYHIQVLYHQKSSHDHNTGC